MKALIGSFVAALIVFQGVAQRGENDDMYFTAKDREKLRVTASATASTNDKIDGDYNAFRKKHFDKADTVTIATNPSDSYSARNVNPEYISRSNSEQASEDEQNYYVEGGYATNTFDSYSSGNYNNYNDNLSYNNSYNNNLNYNNSYGSSSWNSYSPSYGYCDPFMSPYYGGGSGMMISLSYLWGSGGSYYNPYGYNSYGSSPYYQNYGYPTTYGSSEPSGAHYGKRPSRHSAIVNPIPRSSQNVSSNTSGSPNGRTRQSVDEYYIKPSKRVSTFENTTSDFTTDRYKTNSTDFSKTRESYNSNSSRDSKPAYSAPTRSSSSSSPSRSSAGSSSRSRGRD